MKTKIQISSKEIKKVISEQVTRLQEDGLEKFIGDPADRKIEYPEVAPVDAETDAEKPTEFDGGTAAPGEAVDGDFVNRMQSAPTDLIAYLDKIEEAKSLLSKIAAKETDQEVKNKIYAHYEKVHKVGFELIKEFGIVH